LVSEDRWERAQAYERGYWATRAESIARGPAYRLGFYKWRADQLVKLLNANGLQNLTAGASSVVEIGSGPVGVISFYPGTPRIAVDPLESHYRDDPRLTELRDPEVSYREGVGERLPVPDGAADLVIMENCIDHTRDIVQVMNEIGRILRPMGVVYITVNCRTLPGFFVHRLLSLLAIDAGHPHTFTSRRARRLIREHPHFDLRLARHESYLQALWDDLKAGPRGVVKGLLGVSEFVTTVIGTRGSHGAT
jgi:SAM-dependent methyltransferase